MLIIKPLEVRWAIAFTAIIFLVAGCGVDEETSDVADTAAPMVSASTPAINATGVPTTSSVSATFTEPMNKATLTTASFTLGALTDNVAVTGTVDVNGTTATFTPSAPLAETTQYTATITSVAADAANNVLAADYAWQFTTGAIADTTAPMVSATTPAINATGVPTTSSISATFTEPMNNATLTTASFTLTTAVGNVAVTGTVDVNGTTATFTPSVPLAGTTQYTATITTAAADAANNVLAADYAWQFTTGAIADTTAPMISATTPAINATGVATTSSISATFTEPMNNATLTTASFTLTTAVGNVAVTGTVDVNGTTATFTPSAPLAGTTQYTATITTAAADAANNVLAADYAWQFTTGAIADTTAPMVSATTPAINATGVPTTSSISATFTEPMNNATLTTASFTLTTAVGNVAVTGTVDVNGTTATFTPSVPLAGTTQYTATITTAAADAANNVLAADYAWQFTTGAIADTTAPMVSATTPAINATGVPTTSSISATFTEPMNNATLTTASFTLTTAVGNVAVTGTVDVNGTTATFTPSVPLAGTTQYTATITTAAADAANNVLAADYAWQFTTGAIADTTAPMISATTPAINATGVPTTSSISATFTEPMNNATLTTASFTLTTAVGNVAVTGTVDVNGTTATFTPSVPLAGTTQYTATITTAAADAANNVLAADYAWQFTTTTPTLSYATSFNLTENPIFESGRWVNGFTDGLLWNNMQTASGVAYATSTNPTGYDDNLAHLTGIAANQYIEGVVHRESGYLPTNTHEIELLLRFAITPNNARGYEILINTHCCGVIVRWNGPLGDFTILPTTGPGFNTVKDGDIFRAEINNSTIRVYQNSVLIWTVTDTTWTDGNPGIGSFMRGNGNVLGSFGWASIIAGPLP